MVQEHEQCREDARSRVRRYVTYFAGGYAFGGPIALMVLSFIPSIPDQAMDSARNAYMMSAALAGMIVGWWFRQRDEDRS